MLTRTDLPVPVPCDADWNAMDGDARARVCARCERAVHDLSMMRLSEVARLVSGAEPACVRYRYRSTDGRLVMPVVSTEVAASLIVQGLPGVLRSHRSAGRVARLSHLATAVRGAFGQE